MEAIQEALAAESDEAATKILGYFKGKSPTSLKVTLEQMRRGGQLGSIEECLEMEFTMVQNFMAGHDFFEGVRALLVDKDKSPKWQPEALTGVSATDVEKYFKPLSDKPLSF